MTYLTLAVIKVCDNILLTAKSISTYKGQKILSSILVAISQLIFYVIIDQVVSDSTLTSILIISIASGIGNYLAFMINDKFKKDDVWENIITSSDKDFLVNLCTMLREHRVKYLLYETLNRRFEQSYTVTAFTKTKAESRLIDEYLKNTDVKYLRMIDGVEVK
jgi:uncharacterized protein YebE (UPF0316 family)